MVHPQLKTENRSYSDLQFDWDPMDLDSNILGVKVKPVFKANSTSLEASATFATGHGINKVGLKIKVQRDKSIVSIRNRVKIFSTYYTCQFAK